MYSFFIQLKRNTLILTAMGLLAVLSMQSCALGSSAGDGAVPFGFRIQGLDTRGGINYQTKTIFCYIESDSLLDPANLVPELSLAEGVTVSPESGIAQDFTDPVTYTLTYSDASTDTFTVTVQKGGAISPVHMAALMGAGINLGNTLDATPNEGSWTNGVTAKSAYFDDYVQAGFQSVRIPITWMYHQANSSPYAVDSVFLARVKEVADWGLSRGLVVVVNTHHEDWIRVDWTADAQARFNVLWTQIALEFKDYSPRLVFEILNEPRPPFTAAQSNSLNATVLDIIRNSGGSNSTRCVVIGGTNWNGLDSLTSSSFSIPDDDWLIGTFHFYNPYNFAINESGGAVNTWGSSDEIAQLRSWLSSAASWSSAHGLPVYMGEYGVLTIKDASSRLRWYQTTCALARQYGIAYAAWEDNGNFGIYNRSTRVWETSILKAIFGYQIVE